MSQFSTPTQTRVSDKAVDHVRVLRALACRVITAKVPSHVLGGFVHDVRIYKDRCATLNTFVRGGRFTPKVQIALRESMHSLGWSAINFGYDVNTQTTAAPANASGSADAGAAAAAASAVPVGNTGTTSTGHAL